MYDPPEELVSRILSGRVKSVPQVLLRLLNLSNNPNADFDEMASLIEKDAALSARVLRLAATPAYRQWNQVRDLRRLITAIGSNGLRTMIVTSAMAQLFRRMAGEELQKIREIWLASLCCAYSARELARLSAYPHPEEAYVAGLMHRIGQLALLDAFPEDYPAILDDTAAPIDLGALEKQKFGADHAVLGGWLLDHWGLDNLLADAVRYQFEPAPAVDHAHPLVRLVQLAARLSGPAAARNKTFIGAADRWFGLTDPMLTEIGRQALAQADADVRLIGIDAPAGDATKSGIDALAEQALRTGLLGATRIELGELDDIDKVLLAARRQIDLLFEIRSSVFFLVENDVLVGRPQADQDAEIAQLSLPLDTDSGLLGAALSSARLQSTFSDAESEAEAVQLSVLDRQLLRRLGGDGLIVLPLQAAARLHGLLVLGLPRQHAAVMARQGELLELYASQLAEMLALQAAKRDAQLRERLEQRAHYEQQARDIVHEANNPLSIVSNYLHVLSARLEKDDASVEHLDVIREEIDRIGKILLRLPESYVSAEEAAGWVDVPTVINQLVAVFQATLFKAKQIHVNVEAPSDLPLLRCDRDRFKQILINLLKNAGEAVEPQGWIQVRVRDAVNAGGRVYVEVAVIDDGPGVAAEQIDRLFRPQASQKGAGHSGLGLTIAANLARELDAQISYRAQDPGACFQLLIPRLVYAAPGEVAVTR